LPDLERRLRPLEREDVLLRGTGGLKAPHCLEWVEF
jgi:hypothetical protein